MFYFKGPFLPSQNIKQLKVVSGSQDKKRKLLKTFFCFSNGDLFPVPLPSRAFMPSWLTATWIQLRWRRQSRARSQTTQMASQSVAQMLYGSPCVPTLAKVNSFVFFVIRSCSSVGPQPASQAWVNKIDQNTRRNFTILSVQGQLLQICFNIFWNDHLFLCLSHR